MTQKMVLLVEGDPDIRDIVQDVLEADGYDVIPASHGRQAIEFLNAVRATTPPALVILDLKMQFSGGGSVLDAIRGDRALASVPIVVMSAGPQEAPAGVAALLRKPFSLASLFDAVRSLAGAQDPQYATARAN